MKVEQAVFTSLRKCRVQGYHLVGRSPGIDERLAAVLTQWGPSHDSLAENHPRADSLNFHPACDGWFVVSRTVYGGPEYSGRGGLQVVTAMLVLRPEQLDAYQSDPVAMARTARAAGLLRFTPDFPATLPRAELPEFKVYRWIATPPAIAQRDAVAEVTDRLQRGDRVAVFGLTDPMSLLEGLFNQVPLDHRSDLSFSTGLKPSLHRNFRVHFLAGNSSRSQQEQLSALGIRSVVVGEACAV